MAEFRLTGKFKSINRLIKRKVDSSSVIRGQEELTGAQGHIIGYVSRKNEAGKDVFQKDLEKELTLRRSSVTGLLSSMEKKGFIERQGVDGDKRQKKIVLTDKAKAFNKGVTDYFDGLDKEIENIFTLEEYENLKEYLQRIEDYLKKEKL